MATLLMFSIFSIIAIFFVIWYCIYCYSNKWIATFIILALLGIVLALFISFVNSPTDNEIQDHIHKSLNI